LIAITSVHAQAWIDLEIWQDIPLGMNIMFLSEYWSDIETIKYIGKNESVLELVNIDEIYES